MTAPKYVMTAQTVKLADDVARHLFKSPFDDLSRPQQISVADHVWQMGLPYSSRAIKTQLGVAHG